MRKRKIRKLTEEQKKLISDNIGLMRYYCGKELRKGCIPNSYEDQFIGELEENFCKAAFSFDEKRNVKFSTYAYKSFITAKINFFRRIKRVEKTSLFLEYDDIEEKYLWNSISGYGRKHLDINKIMELIEEVDLTKKEINCIKLYYRNGLYLRQIGDIYNVSRERIRQIISKALNKIRAKIIEEEYTKKDFYVEK